VSKKLKIYIEGWGDHAKLKRACRRAFSKFFAKAGFAGRMPGVWAMRLKQTLEEEIVR